MNVKTVMSHKIKNIYINKEIQIIKVLIMDLKNINEMKTAQESHQEI